MHSIAVARQWRRAEKAVDAKKTKTDKQESLIAAVEFMTWPQGEEEQGIFLKQPDTKKLRVMIVDDSYRTLQALPGMIAVEEFEPLWVADARQALLMLENEANDVRIIIIDLKTSGMGGGGFLQQVRRIVPHAALLIVGPLGPFLYQKGSFYELQGPSLKKNINTILLSIARKMNLGNSPESNIEQAPERKVRYGVIIGKSEGINKIYQLIDNLKDTAASVLIQGESGTGKELVARTIFQTSRRKKRPFVAINCGAIQPNLIESELFGHEKGAFTSANQQRKGKFEEAEGGTLFLDEIGELDRELQVKLLRVLQEKEYQRVGGNKTLRSDVRIIAATSRDLKAAVAAGSFRDDLFYRLNVLPILIPPLRKRQMDIPLLLEHFLEKSGQEWKRQRPLISARAKEALCSYSYPGNIRELINVVERIFITCPNGKVNYEDLPDELRTTGNSTINRKSFLTELPEKGVLLQEVEKELIMKTLELTKGNKMAAAGLLGITRRRLYLRLSQYDGCQA
jgi:DNA-binding NtrC family response regulator